MKILIIGRNGFIGKSLIEYFNKKDSYTITATSRSELNLLNEACVKSYLETNGFDVIINTAIFTKSKESPQLWQKELENDLRMFFNLAKYSHLYGKMIYLGSGAEFDKSKSIISANEDWECMIPASEYGFAKYIMNHAAKKSNNIYNLRVFGLFGKYENYRKKFITGACAKAVCDLPLTIRQNVYFDFLYINDFCEMLERFIGLKDPQYHDYNIVSGRKIDLFSLMEIVNKVSKKSLPIIICKSGLANEYTADNSRLMKEIGHVKLTDFQESIKELYEYYLEHKNAIDIMSLIYQG